MNRVVTPVERDATPIGDLYEGLVEATRPPLAVALLRFADRTVLDIVLALIPGLLTWIASQTVRGGGDLRALQVALVVVIVLALVAFWGAAFAAWKVRYATNSQTETAERATPAQPRDVRGGA